MRHIFFVFFLFFASVVSAQTIKNNEKMSILVLDYVEVKDGQGCTQATKKTKFPLSAKECEVMLAENGMFPRVDRSNPMMQIIKEATIRKGTTFAYVFNKRFNGWVLVDKD